MSRIETADKVKSVTAHEVINRNVVNGEMGSTRDIHWMKAYPATVSSGKNVPQFIIQGNWVEQCGFEVGCSVRVECYPNKLVILKE